MPAYIPGVRKSKRFDIRIVRSCDKIISYLRKNIYSLLRNFHSMVFSHQSRELDLWITKAEQLQIDEVNTYINSLKNDIMAVKNGIDFKYNNRLADGSVNKIS